MSPKPELSWRVGDVRACALELVSEIEIRPTPDADARAVVHRIAGVLIARVQTVGEERVELGCQLADAEFTVDGHGDARSLERCCLPFLASFERSGRLLACRFSEALTMSESLQIEEAMRSFQLVVDAPLGADHWTVEEASGSGVSSVRYELDRAAGRLIKRRVDLRPGEALGPGSSATVLGSEIVARWKEPALWPCAIQLVEEQRVHGGGGLELHCRVRGRLEHVDPYLYADALPLRRAVTLADLQDHPRVAAASSDLSGEPPGVPIRVARERFAALIARVEQDDRPHFATLREAADLLLAHPELTQDLLHVLGRTDLSMFASASLVHTLELAGSEACQGALGGLLLGDGFNLDTRLRAAVAAAGLSAPGDRMLESLWTAGSMRSTQHERWLADSSLLAVGALAETLREGDPVAYSRVRARFVDGLRRADSPDERAALLGALKNMHDAALTSELEPYLDSSTPGVRAAAAEAWIASGPPDPAPRLVGLLALEPAAKVRIALARGLDSASVDGESVGRVRELVFAEPDPDVRYELTRCLKGQLTSYPELEDALTELSRRDPSDRVRRLAAEALIGLRRG